MALSTRYNPEEIESKWYDHWMEKNYFHSEPDDRESYSIVIPPPNVTGVLHMGHMLDNTIQDVLIRKARLEGKNACWVPGMDHASIATEAKVVKMLRERGIKKSDLTREEFLNYAYEWKHKYGGIILEQLKRLGASCDWDRTRFTMEPKLSKAVTYVFVDLYRKGKLYRGLRMTNWDPAAQTVLSNEEVLYEEENSPLYYVRYQVENSADEYITIATVRPETILGDTAIAVHPDDERYRDLIGKRVLVPLVNRSIPVIADSYVDQEFGTGALKITPAHDSNDYDLGQKHGLEVIDVLNADGTMSEAAGFFIGEDRFVARKLIAKKLKELDLLVKVEDYRNKVGRSERTNAIVEPRLTRQWFMDIKVAAKTALKAVESGEVTFHPGHFWNMYYSWLREENVRDWCISRQLWWGHRIPAWYYEEEVFVAETPEEALDQAREKLNLPNLTLDDLQQDEDVVDTWFSSWLWPLSVFDGFEEDTTELAYYYPTNVLVTGWDIMFLWVARMIMAGYEWSEELLGKEIVEKKGRQPFDHVYFHGMVRDNQRRKMSKSLGNSPEAISLIEKYGADGVRFGMLSSGSAGNDIIFDAPFDPKTKKILNESKLCEEGRNFCNKVWNAMRLIKSWDVTDQAVDHETTKINELAGLWMENKLQATLETVKQNFEDFRLSDALMALKKLIWGDFCSWYLEMIKPSYGKPVDSRTLERTIAVFEDLLVMLHPFMPFITEEVWHHLRDRLEGEDCVVSTYPVVEAYDQAVVDNVERAKDLVTAIRDFRNSNGLKMKELLKVGVQETGAAKDLFAVDGLKEMVIKMANLEALEFTKEEVPNSISFVSSTEKYFVEMEKEIDFEEERSRLLKDLDYYKGFLKSVQRKLENDKFVNNAPDAVVERERQKLEDGKAKIKHLEEALEQLG